MASLDARMAIVNSSFVPMVQWKGEDFLPGGPLAVCAVIPPQLNSYGVWERSKFGKDGLTVWEYPLPLFESVVALLFILWQVFDLLFKKLGIPMPKFTSQMLIGVGLGYLGRLDPDSKLGTLFKTDGHRLKAVRTFGAFGFTLYWFLKGVKMDVGMITRTGARATISGLSSFCLPVLVLNLVYGARQSLGRNGVSGPEYRILIFMQSLTSFTGIAKLLWDMKLHHSEIGRIALSAAMVGDMVGLSVNFLGIFFWTGDWGTTIKIVVGIVGFILAAFFLLRPAMFWIIRRTPERRPVRDIYVQGIVMLAFISFFYWKRFGQFPALGPFVVGLAVPDGPPLGSALVERFESFNAGVILPIFAIMSMTMLDLTTLMEDFADLWVLGPNGTDMFEPLMMILLAALAKFVACTIPPYALKMPMRDSFVLALILSHKGIVELGYYSYACDTGALDVSRYNLAAFFILLNSLIYPFIIHLLYDPSKKYAGYQKRNIGHLKPNADIKFLVCVHKPDHITCTIKLLETICPSDPEDQAEAAVGGPLSSLVCYAVHLVELLGQDHSVFISHRYQKPKVGSRAYSDNLIISFEHFQRRMGGSVSSLDTYTSISAPKYMHDDICNLALDKSVAMILCPFHRTWSADGSFVMSEDLKVRKFNCKVLKNAPCSIGILVNRNTLRDAPADYLCQVCAIFVGGRDDREALALVKRMARNHNVKVTVLRLVTPDNDIDTAGWDQMLDKSEIKELLRLNNDNNKIEGHVNYVEERVEDGTDTSRLLRSVALDFDFFVVGRGSGGNAVKGLEEWSELEELGVIGDILASPDFSTSASVLVVQQQQHVVAS